MNIAIIVTWVSTHAVQLVALGCAVEKILEIRPTPNLTRVFLELSGTGAAEAAVKHAGKFKLEGKDGVFPTLFALAGIVAAIALFIFNHLAKRWQDVNA